MDLVINTDSQALSFIRTTTSLLCPADGSKVTSITREVVWRAGIGRRYILRVTATPGDDGQHVGVSLRNTNGSMAQSVAPAMLADKIAQAYGVQVSWQHQASSAEAAEFNFTVPTPELPKAEHPFAQMALNNVALLVAMNTPLPPRPKGSAAEVVSGIDFRYDLQNGHVVARLDVQPEGDGLKGTLTFRYGGLSSTFAEIGRLLPAYCRRPVQFRTADNGQTMLFVVSS